MTHFYTWLYLLAFGLFVAGVGELLRLRKVSKPIDLDALSAAGADKWEAK